MQRRCNGVLRSVLVVAWSRHLVYSKAAETQVKRQRVISAVHVCVYLSTCTEYLKAARVSGGSVSQALSVSCKTCGGMFWQSSAGIEASKVAFVQKAVGP